MKLCSLLSQDQRQLFKRSMIEARAAKGGRFRENARSRVSDIQLTFGTLYGIFDDESGHPDRLLGGFCIHALDEFGESFSVPEINHELIKYPPYAVFEAGQLWSLNREAALSLRTACMILLGLLQAQALLIYPVIIPRDVSTFYRVFRRIGQPFTVPYAKTLEGEKIWMHAMLLDGGELRDQIRSVGQHGYETQGEHTVIRFRRPPVAYIAGLRQVKPLAMPFANGLVSSAEK
jgi:hypothetical protein